MITIPNVDENIDSEEYVTLKSLFAYSKNEPC